MLIAALFLALAGCFANTNPSGSSGDFTNPGGGPGPGGAPTNPGSLGGG
jgi:hypothetical protein